MSVNTFDIQEGMEVFTSDGQKIGNVDKVRDSAGSATESGSQAMSTADESDSGNVGDGTSNFGGIFDLDRDSGGGAGPGVDITRDPNDMREEYGTTAIATGTQGDTGYFKVSEGGVLGIGAKTLYIPFTAVETVAADGVVTLSCTKDEAGNRFDHEPNGGDNSNSSDTPIV